MYKSNIKSDHIFPIVRVDMFQFKEGRAPTRQELEMYISVSKTMHTEEGAQKEVGRLNGLRKGKGSDSFYFYTISRIKKDANEDSKADTDS